ncbi:MAG: hypothetical protein RLZZ15_796 [Verrucomicrobiota bacterium]|jgi:hypothetical protein
MPQLAAATPSPPPPAARLDVVYTWVDGGEAGFQRRLREFSTAPAATNAERYRDPAELLRHSLRSMETFFPDFGRVFLVTARPQVPAWLDRAHPRLSVVHHDAFFDDPGALPAFNSNVIESFLHRVPGVTPRFLYLNDDYFFGAPCSSADFVAPDGRPRVCGSFFGERFRARVYERQLVSFGALEHGPLLVDRAEWIAALATAPAEIAALRRHRFRQPDDLRPDRLYRWYLLARGRGVAEPAWRYLRYARFLKLRDDPVRLARQLARLRAARPKFFCLNDDLGPAPQPASFAAVTGFLADYFPQPSSFERTPPD